MRNLWRDLKSGELWVLLAALCVAVLSLTAVGFFTSRISENEEIDLPLTIMNLESQKVAYQAALGAASKIMQSSLVDFLR